MELNWITFWVALVAAITGVFNLVWAVLDRSDRILVRLGSIYPREIPTWDMYVVNRGKISVELRDYGFVGRDGELMSVPAYYEFEACYTPPEYRHDASVGSNPIPPHSSLSLYVDKKGDFVGAYAITSTQSVKSVYIRESVIKNPKLLYIWFKAKFLN